MSDAECGAICVRKDVMDKFNVIMEETKLDANELMEHFFSLYNCCVKLVHPIKPGMAQNGGALNASQMTQQQMLQHFQSQQQAGVKTENEDFIPVGMTYNANSANTSSNMGDGSEGSKNSSMSESDEVTCLGVTQIGGDCSVEEKVQLLQRLREQANSSSFNSSQPSGIYQHYSSFSGSMGPPSMVPMPGLGDLGQPPRKRKKTPKRAKLSASPAQIAQITEGEDILKSSMCSLCQATFARFTDLLAHHKEVHNSDTNHPLRCRACGRTQTSEAGLIYHQVYVCKMVERTHQCHICGLKFQSEGMVLVHKCSGCPRKKYACEFCDHYRTESSSDLEKHMRIHTNDKCYVCKICGFSTAWKKNLKEHMVKHLGLKPYVCDLCGYSTSDRHNLRSHRMKHYQKGEGCEKCGGECHCNKTVSGKKRKISVGSVGESNTSGGGSGGGGSSSPGVATTPAGGKDLECPYPQCVYRTKLEYMMANHMLRHQGSGDQNNASGSGGVVSSSSGGGGSGGGGHFSGANSQSSSHENTKTSQQHRGQGVMASGQYTGSGGAGTAASPASSISSSSSVPPTSSISNNQSGPPTLISSPGNQLPLEWKNIGQPHPSAVCGMLSPPTHFPPLVQHQQSHLTSQAVASGALSSWATPLSPPAVPPGLLSNRVAVPMSAQNMVARPMPVFPNMPN
ncbi:zinc finger protein 652-A [Aplysia californica]|uniref:Zinc finger protein 652-A n=1 Tax=Aplysia californica TaxID=6500 RepID=A0ABM0JXQ0_APLCA|nr:zinc finger protein 652-A [Aplysia californica]